MEEIHNAPQAEDKGPETTTPPVEVKTEETPLPEPKKEETISELLKAETKPKEERTVPESALLEYKNQNKELKKDIKELKDLIQSGATKQEVSQDLEKIALEHNVDIEFLNKLAGSLKATLKSEIDSEIKPIRDKENKEKIDKIFEEHYTKTIEQMPEYKNVVDRETIKALSLLPQNANKTFREIIDQAYGRLIPGRATLETTRARLSDLAEINYDLAQKDQNYFKEIMQNPELKRKYNAGLGKRVGM